MTVVSHWLFQLGRTSKGFRKTYSLFCGRYFIIWTRHAYILLNCRKIYRYDALRKLYAICQQTGDRYDSAGKYRLKSALTHTSTNIDWIFRTYSVHNRTYSSTIVRFMKFSQRENSSRNNGSHRLVTLSAILIAFAAPRYQHDVTISTGLQARLPKARLHLHLIMRPLHRKPHYALCSVRLSVQHGL